MIDNEVGVGSPRASKLGTNVDERLQRSLHHRRALHLVFSDAGPLLPFRSLSHPPSLFSPPPSVSHAFCAAGTLQRLHSAATRLAHVLCRRGRRFREPLQLQCGCGRTDLQHPDDRGASGRYRSHDIGVTRVRTWRPPLHYVGNRAGRESGSCVSLFNLQEIGVVDLCCVLLACLRRFEVRRAGQHRLSFLVSGRVVQSSSLMLSVSWGAPAAVGVGPTNSVGGTVAAVGTRRLCVLLSCLRSLCCISCVA